MEFVFNAFVTLLVIIDPLGMAPIFAALTKGFSEKRKRESAIRGTVLGGLILYAFAIAGDVLLEAVGIGLPAFRIAGGLLLFLLSLDMVFARPSGMRATAVREQEEEEYQQDISVFPLAIPLLAGPGGITTVLLYTGGSTVGQVVLFMAVLFVVLVLTLISLLLAPRVMRLLGETGANVLARVLGVLLAALSVQFVIDGLQSSFA
jgi:multiple antibiotic resistance protein